MKNFVSKIGSSKFGTSQGRTAFQAFLLAGERFHTANFKRKGTFESAYEKFYAELSKSEKKIFKGYFEKQSKLALAQRALLLGDLANIRITAPLRLMTLSPKALAFKRLAATLKDSDTKEKPCNATLSVILHSIKVKDSQDEYSIWTPWKTYWKNQSDEVVISAIGIDDVGNVLSKKIDLGSIREGTSGGFQKELLRFNVCANNMGFPKFYETILTFFEKDSGSYNDLVNKAVKVIKEQVTEELIEQGIGLGANTPIPEGIADELTGILTETFHLLVDFIGSLFRNGDEIMGEITSQCHLHTANNDWTSQKLETVLRAHNGQWHIKYYWKLKV